MPLESGTFLGHYEILEPTGRGGQGEVYQARDTRLDRTVAIKVLPEHLADDPERRERFEREARAVSSLNHPNICTLHDVGSQDGDDFLVMEYLEGETLADRLERGPLPLDEALRHARAMADALGKAHRHGVVPRDLKPANVVLTKEGPKLLDFGLAKLASASEEARALSSVATEARPLTEDGAILGTFQYMAPEQLEGGNVDARTDIFAFGAVLYEMVTGRRAFQGKSQASVIAAILERDPEPVSSVRPMSPPALDRVVQRCLAKDPDARWQNALDLGIELSWVTERTPEPPSPRGSSRKLVANVLGAAAVAVLATWWVVRSPSPETRFPLRLSLDLGEDARLPASSRPPFDISPDGRLLVYVSRPTGNIGELWLRSLDNNEPRRIPGSEDPAYPVFSPDGRFIAFTARGALFKVAVEGGEPLPIGDWTPTRVFGEWAVDDFIYFSEQYSGIFRVSAVGGEPETVTVVDEERDELAHRWPHVLPGGRALTMTVRTSDGFRTAVHSLETGEPGVVREIRSHRSSRVRHSEPSDGGDVRCRCPRADRDTRSRSDRSPIPVG